MAPIIVGALSALATLMAGVTGASLLLPGTPLDFVWRLRPEVHEQMAVYGTAVGLLLLAIFAIGLAVTIGSFQRRQWAWLTAIIVLGVNGLSDVGRIFFGGVIEGLIGIAVAGLLIVLLLRPGVRAQFSR